MKSWELWYLYGSPGNYCVTLRNKRTGNRKDLTFLWHSKKEMFCILRQKHNCIVSHDFY